MSFSGINTNNPGSILAAIAEMHASLLASIPNGQPPSSSAILPGPSNSFIDFALPVDSVNISTHAASPDGRIPNPTVNGGAFPPHPVIPALPALPPLTTRAVGEETGFFPLGGISTNSPVQQSAFDNFFNSFITSAFADEGAANTRPAQVTTLAVGEETGELPPPIEVGTPDPPESPETPSPEDSAPPAVDPAPVPAPEPPGPEPNLLNPPPPPPAITLQRGEEGSLFTFDDPRKILAP
ncbi:MAG: hypothetical protein O3B01_08680 [Planctomycetota bacterium]|nr:hypothetical protein [Planctomycetota bacterium]